MSERLVLGAVVTTASSNLAGLRSTPTSPSTEELWGPWQQRGELALKVHVIETIYRFMLLVFGDETLGSN